MAAVKFPELKIGKSVARVPIIQGGMGVGISLSGLASAVAKEGGVGVIASAGIAMLEPDYARDVKAANKRALFSEIQKAKAATSGPIGVNILVALSDYEDLSLVALEAGADILFLGAGLPFKIFSGYSKAQVRDAAIAIVPIVSSARACKIIFDYWIKNYERVPDGVVVEGPMAGGHLGYKKEQLDDPAFKLEVIVKDVIALAAEYSEKYKQKIPVVAGGGIYTGYDIHEYFKLGVDGVQMATRFVATYECDACEEFKQTYIKSTKEDICIIDSPVGLPGRAVKNDFLDQVSKGNKMPFSCPWKCLRTCDYKVVPYCIALALVNAKNGKFGSGFAFAGENAYRVEKIVSVKELMDELAEEFSKASA